MTNSINGGGIVPAFTTGGGGFFFEDVVGGWAAAALLSGNAPVGVEVGTLREVRFQAAALDRIIDDLLLTGEAQPEPSWAASIKSFDMLTGAKLEPKFVETAWRELLEGRSFDGDWDRIGLVCPSAAETNWNSLKKLISAAQADRTAMHARIKVSGAFNEHDRSIWASCRCPQELAERHGIDPDSSPSRLLGVLIPRRLDLLDPGSASLVEAQRWCEEALIPEQAIRGKDLWEALLTIVSEIRPQGGALDWPLLIRRLTGRFDLRLRPDIEPDWRILRHSTDEAVNAVRDQLGDGVHLPRAEAWATLQNADEAPVIALSGPSGCGKTALAKRWLGPDKPHSLWLSSSDLDEGLVGLRSRLNLRRAVAETLKLAPAKALIVIDGLDRSYEGSHFVAAASLARLAAESGGGIQLLFTCQQMELPRVAGQIADANGPSIEIVAIENLDASDVRLVLDKEPELAKVAVAGQLHSVLRRPKLLDLLLRASKGSEHLLKQASDETGVADLWWQQMALAGADAAVRQELLMKLAIDQADRLSSFTPAGNLSPSEVTSAETLRKDGILEESRARYEFAHDLFVDWVLLQRLQALGEEATGELVSKGDLPSWHRAIRLHALWVLRYGGLEAWSAERRHLDDADHRLLADLFLDAPLFAQDAAVQLRALWPALIEDEGKLLRRLLRRFRHVATVPDATGAAIFTGATELETHWSIQTRVPLWPLWIPLVELLYEHRDVAIDLAVGEVAAIVDLWLRRVCPGRVFCERTSALAIEIGRFVLAESESGVFFEAELEESLWRCVLAAGAVEPQAVLDLIGPALEAPGEDNK